MFLCALSLITVDSMWKADDVWHQLSYSEVLVIMLMIISDLFLYVSKVF